MIRYSPLRLCEALSEVPTNQIRESKGESFPRELNIRIACILGHRQHHAWTTQRSPGQVTTWGLERLSLVEVADGHVDEKIGGTQAFDRMPNAIVLCFLGTIRKGNPVAPGLQLNNNAATSPPIAIMRTVIPRRKGATALHVQVGVDNPKGGIRVVDAKHFVCSTADANCSIRCRANQLVRLNTATMRITLPEEGVRYIC